MQFEELPCISYVKYWIRVRLLILSQNEERFGGDPSIYFYQICLVIYHRGCHIRAISAVKRPICLDQQMHVDSFAKFFETLNCYIKKNYEMKYRNNCKIFTSTRGEFNNQLMCYNAFVMYYWSPLFLNGVTCLQMYTPSISICLSSILFLKCSKILSCFWK